MSRVGATDREVPVVLTASAGGKALDLEGLAARLERDLQPTRPRLWHLVLAADAQAEQFLVEGGGRNRVAVLVRRLALFDPDFIGRVEPGWCKRWLRSGKLMLVSFVGESPRMVEQALEAAIDEIRNHVDVSQPPTLDDLASALSGPDAGSAYLASVIDKLPWIIRDMCLSDRIRRARAGNLVGVLHFCGDSLGLLNRLGDLAIESARLARGGPPERADELRRCADTCLYLALELSARNIELALVPFVDRVLPELGVFEGDWVLWCRGLRDSYLKGLALKAARPKVMQLVEATDSDDAVAFQVIDTILEGGRGARGLSEMTVRQLCDRILGFKSRTVVRLAHDLRRVVPKSAPLGTDHSDTVIARLELALTEDPDSSDGEVWLARLLLLLAAGCAGPRLLTWIYGQHERIGLSAVHRDLLAAVAGFDVPFMLGINLRMREHGVSVPVPPPSRHATIQAYMADTLSRWARPLAASGDVGADTVTTGPLVTVVVTTFSPDLELFALSLRSVIRQRHVRLEVLIVDDASPPSIGKMLQECVESMRTESAHDLVYIRNDSNKGQYRSRNEAIARARGEFIAIQDDDDISYPDRVWLQLQPMLRNPAVMATHAQHLRISSDARLMVDGDRIGQAEGDAPVSFIWRTQVFRDVGEFLPTRTRGDIEFRQRLRRRYPGRAVVSLPLPLVLMRGGLETVSASQEYHLRSAVAALRHMMDYTNSDAQDPASLQRWIPTHLR